MKKLFTFLFMIVLLLGLVGCGSGTEAEACTYVNLRINPEIGLYLDANGKVLETVAYNSDADVLLSDMNVKGKDIGEVATTIISEATDAGYIDPENTNTEIYVEVEDGNEEVVEKIKDKICTNIENYFNNKGMFGKISSETLDKYSQLAFDLGLSVGKTKMILLAIDTNPELSLDTLANMEMNEIIKLCHENMKNNNYGSSLNKEFKAEKTALREKYAELFTICERIKEIDLLIIDETIDEATVNSLNEEKANLIVKRDELKALYDEELSTLKAEYFEKKQEFKETCQQNKQNRKNGQK